MSSDHNDAELPRVSINIEDATGHDNEDKEPAASAHSGWDGKLRIEKTLELANPEAFSDPELSDEENVMPGEQLEADEDLLDDYPPSSTEIDLIHARISSISLLRVTAERFPQLQRLCLRQNAIVSLEGLDKLPTTLTELDLYDNLIPTLPSAAFGALKLLKSLDLSFNKLKHIKHISHLVNLTDLYFVQNKISQIQNLAGLHNLRNLELAANRIREIENLETLTSLEELWLGKNKITEIKGIDTLQNLKILSIQSNRLRSIDGLSNLSGLEELYISHNAIMTLEGLASCMSLKVLDCSNNHISSLVGIRKIMNLEEVWASYNNIEDFRDVEENLADKKNLSTVYFEGNPLQTKGPAVYRNKLKLTLPRVQQLDATFVRVG